MFTLDFPWLGKCCILFPLDLYVYFGFPLARLKWSSLLKLVRLLLHLLNSNLFHINHLHLQVETEAGARARARALYHGQHVFAVNTPPPPHLPSPIPLLATQQPFDQNLIQIHNLGPMNVVCPDCHAHHWSVESLS
jgi:hypothetical protein